MSRRWNFFRYLGRRQPPVDLAGLEADVARRAPVPCLWLLGKTGSGKTSVIRYLTGADEAEIGPGFRPQTTRSRLYDFPDPDWPIVRFLDTRGLGEATYDSTDDLGEGDATTHLVVVTVRAVDHATAAIIEPLRSIRRATPDRPVLLLVTCLHDLYPGAQHPRPDPYDESVRPLPSTLPDALSRSLAHQYDRFDGLFDRAVPIDLTQPADGFLVPDFGGGRLKRAVLDLLPRAYRRTLHELDQVTGELRLRHARQAERTILAHAVVAASAAAVPVPWVDVPFVLATQSHLIRRLAADDSHRLDKQTLVTLTSVLGGRVAFRLVTRELWKLIPWLGLVMNAAAAFVSTYALGHAASWYFREVAAGHLPSAETLREVFHHELRRGAELWRETREGPGA